MLMPYINNQQILVCPSTGTWSYQGTTYHPTSLCWNYMFGYVPGLYATYPCGGVKDSQVTLPSEKVCLLDGSVAYAYWDWTYPNPPAVAYAYWDWTYPNPPGLYGAYYSFEGNCSMFAYQPFIDYLSSDPGAYKKAFVHQGGVNCVFADGHAKWLHGRNMLGRGRELMNPWYPGWP